MPTKNAKRAVKQEKMGKEEQKVTLHAHKKRKTSRKGKENGQKRVENDSICPYVIYKESYLDELIMKNCRFKKSNYEK